MVYRKKFCNDIPCTIDQSESQLANDLLWAGARLQHKRNKERSTNVMHVFRISIRGVVWPLCHQITYNYLAQFYASKCM